ncbi:MAG: GNAT family N-acetyltransferase [Phototrophicaceae bacterium]
MSKPVTIRIAQADDLPTIKALIERFVTDGILLPRTFQELHNLLDNLFVAEMDGMIVGCAALDIYNNKLAEIRSLAVAPEAQGNGVGKLLVQACVERGREQQILEVMAISASEDFFRSCGFDFTLPNLRKAFFIQTRDEI